MPDLLLSKHQRDLLFKRIETLQNEVNVYKDDTDYYRDLLKKTRMKVLKIHNLVGAKAVASDSETVDAAWFRCIDEIIEKLDETL